jgi:hypothetical protein
MEIIFWCEFPEKANWKIIEQIFANENFYSKIYVSCKSKKDLENKRKKIKKLCKHIDQVNPWPLLPKEKGYWFSGYSDKKSIDILKEFKKLNVKVDLEPPILFHKYNLPKIILYALAKYFVKAENKKYLKNTVVDLSKSSKVISNEFPLPVSLLNQYGCHIDVRKYKNMEINFIFYSTFVKYFRFILRSYYKWFAKKAVKKYEDKAMFSLGLLGPGIFGDEPKYYNLDELRKDIESAREAGAKKIAIYSIERLQEQKNPEQWIRLIKSYTKTK